jgi:hypothetical protein
MHIFNIFTFDEFSINLDYFVNVRIEHIVFYEQCIIMLIAEFDECEAQNVCWVGWGEG